MVFTAPGVVEMLDVATPRPAEDDEILIDVVAAGICGSELHGISSPVPPAPTHVSCVTCDTCARGRSQLCRERAIVGIAVPERLLHELPSDLSWEEDAARPSS
jgi:threonine dehydrogenase-like Zn-dependent dehydrogenase